MNCWILILNEECGRHTNFLGLGIEIIRVLVLSMIPGYTWYSSRFMLHDQFHAVQYMMWSLPDIIIFDLLPRTSVKIMQHIYFTSAHLLEPMLTMALAGGPIKTIPACASCSENTAFSLRNPYLSKEHKKSGSSLS